MKRGQLILVPTPIDEENPLERVAFETLLDAYEHNREKSIFVVEDLKPGRRRWIRFGLPRQAVLEFVLYNEHTWEKESDTLLTELKNGKTIYMMSDGGLPAFCDPGRHLVERCHRAEIKVTSTPFCNSIALAIALSGFNHDSFLFEGFLPVKGEDRCRALDKVLKEKRTVVLMDTPYRMKRLLEEVRDRAPNREIFLAMDLNSKKEELHLGAPKTILKMIKDFKREFILLVRNS